MRISTTPIADLVVVDTTPFVDHRGEFSRYFCMQELAQVLGERRIVQINHSVTRTVGAVRGLHFQRPPHTEAKLVRCLHGRVWDVAVDLRPDSPTLLHWHAEELSAANRRMTVIPEGFAHGFQVLEPESELLYLMTAPHTPQVAAGIRHDDPSLAIGWPLSVTDISEQDQCWPLLDAVRGASANAQGGGL